MVSRADGVLRRWNPHGWIRLHEPPTGRVCVAGLPGSGAARLADDLRRLGLDVVSDGPAAVAVVVFEANAVVGHAELALLREAAAETTATVCVLHGVDERPDWPAIRAADLEILHRHAPWSEGAVLLPVTARPDHPEASTLTGLRDVLTATLRAATDPRRARAAVVAGTRLMIEEEIARLAQEDDEAALRDERARLVASARATPTPDLRRLQVELLHETATGLRATATAALGTLEKDGDVAAVAVVDAGLDELGARLTAALTGVAPEVPPVVLTRTPPPPAGVRSLEDVLTVVFGASAGAGLGGLLTAPFGTLPGWTALPVAVVCAVPAAAALVRVRRRIAHRDRMRRWVTEELAVARAELDTWVRTGVHAAEAHHAAGRDRHATRVRDRVAALDARIARQRGERRARLAACERDLAALGHPREPTSGRMRRTG